MTIIIIFLNILYQVTITKTFIILAPKPHWQTMQAYVHDAYTANVVYSVLLLFLLINIIYINIMSLSNSNTGTKMNVVTIIWNTECTCFNAFKNFWIWWTRSNSVCNLSCRHKFVWCVLDVFIAWMCSLVGCTIYACLTDYYLLLL